MGVGESGGGKGDLGGNLDLEGEENLGDLRGGGGVVLGIWEGFWAEGESLGESLRGRGSLDLWGGGRGNLGDDLRGGGGASGGGRGHGGVGSR